MPFGQNRRAAQRFQQHRMVRARSRTKPRDFRRDFTRAKVSSAAPRFPHSPAVIYLPRRRRALSWLSSASSTAGFAAQRGQCALLRQWERRRVILLCGLNHLEVKTLTNRAFRSFTLTLGRKVYTDRAAKSASSRGHAVPLLLQDVSGCASDGDESRDRGLCVILESLIICRTFLWTAVLPRDY